MTLPLSAQDVASTETPGGEDGPAETIAVDDITADSAIADRLTRILTSTDWFTELEVTSENGIVVLVGTADTEEHRQWAGNVARKTKDVIAVIDKLAVNSSVELSSSKQVVKESLQKLWRDFLVRSPLLAAALVIVVITSLMAKLIGWVLYRILDHRRLRTSLKDLIYQFASISVWIVGLLVATVIAFPGMTPSKAVKRLRVCEPWKSLHRNLRTPASISKLPGGPDPNHWTSVAVETKSLQRLNSHWMTRASRFRFRIAR